MALNPNALTLDGTALGTVAENAAPGTALGTLGLDLGALGLDLGGVDPARVLTTYAVDDPRFVVDGSTLRAAVGLDHELQPEVPLTVTATLLLPGVLGLPPTVLGSVSRTIGVAVADVNEAPTALAVALGQVSEAATAGAVLGTVAVVDPDAAGSYAFTVSDSRFAVEDGQIRLAPGHSLAGLGGTSIPLTVTAVEAGFAAVTRTVELLVGGTNRAPTEILLENVRAITKDLRVGDAIADIRVLDPDGDVVTVFQLSDNRLYVEDGKLKLGTMDVLNFQASGQMPLTVQAFDGGGLSATRGFALALDDEDDAASAVLLNQGTSGEVAENAAAGTSLGLIEVIDPDGGAYVFDVSDARFAVVGDHLVVREGAVLDHEAEPAPLAVEVGVTDAQGRRVANTFRIAVLDAAEAPTALALTLADAAGVAANAAVGTVVGTLSGTDPDAGQSEALTFAVDDPRFEVAGAVLRVAAGAVFDHVSETSVALRVTATDADGLSFARDLTVAVHDGNHAPVVLSPDGGVVRVPEGAGAERAVAAFLATDLDGDPLTFALTGEDANLFRVIADELGRGTVMLRENAVLDFAAAPVLRFAVEATDPRGAVGRQDFTVEVLNVAGIGRAPVDDDHPGLPVQVFIESLRTLSIAVPAETLRAERTGDGVLLTTASDRLLLAADTRMLELPEGYLSMADDTREAFLVRLYRGVLGRDGEADGLAHHNRNLRTGLERIDVVREFLDSAEFAPVAATTGDGLFVQRLYERLLGREGEGSGVANWVDRIDEGLSRAEVVMAFLESPESQAFHAQGTDLVWVYHQPALTIRSLYEATLGRAPDAGGLLYWRGEVDRGASTLDVARRMTDAPEFRARHEGQDTAALVESIYVDSLGRASDAEGRAHWIGEIDAGRIDYASLVHQFATSAEELVQQTAIRTGEFLFA